MEDEKFSWIKEEMAEIKEAVKDVAEVVNDMRVLVAGKYVSKKDFEEYKNEEKTNRRWLFGFIITAVGALATLLNFGLIK